MKSALKLRSSGLIYNSENFRFQRCSELNQRSSDISRLWTALNQSWNFFESHPIRAECLWDVNPGGGIKNSKKLLVQVFFEMQILSKVKTSMVKAPMKQNRRKHEKYSVEKE